MKNQIKTALMATALCVAFSGAGNALSLSTFGEWTWELEGDGKTTTPGYPVTKHSKCKCEYTTEVTVGNRINKYRMTCEPYKPVEVDTPTGPEYTCIGACPDGSQLKAGVKPCGKARSAGSRPVNEEPPKPPPYLFDLNTLYEPVELSIE